MNAGDTGDGSAAATCGDTAGGLVNEGDLPTSKSHQARLAPNRTRANAMKAIAHLRRRGDPTGRAFAKRCQGLATILSSPDGAAVRTSSG